MSYCPLTKLYIYTNVFVTSQRRLLKFQFGIDNEKGGGGGKRDFMKENTNALALKMNKGEVAHSL